MTYKYKSLVAFLLERGLKQRKGKRRRAGPCQWDRECVFDKESGTDLPDLAVEAPKQEV